MPSNAINADELGGVEKILSSLWGSAKQDYRDAKTALTGKPDQPAPAAQAGPAAKPKAKKKKAAPKKETQAQQLEQQIQAEEDSPWTQLADSLVGQLQQEQAPVEAALSGALVGPAAQGAESLALQASGIAPGSAAGQWMSSQVAQGAKNADPLMAALSAYGSAYGAGQDTVDQALAAMGQANSASIATSSEQPWLSAIASHLGTGQWGYTVPANVAGQLPPAVQQALKGAGWTVDTASTSKTAQALTGTSATAPTSQYQGPTPSTSVLPTA